MPGWFNIARLFKGKRSDAVKVDRPRGVPAPQRVPLENSTPQRGRKASAARFSSSASDQVDRKGSDRFAAIRSRLHHAFTPSQPVADARMFAGREGVLKSIIRSIEDRRLHVVVYGERGIGKTSILHMLTQAAHDARYIVVYTSCGANSTFEDTFRAAAADIPLLYHSGYSPTRQEAESGGSLADLLQDGPLSPRRFSDLCAKLTGTRVLIILDEFDRSESMSFRRDVAELIKNLSDRLGRVQLVLAGVAADLNELVEHIPSIRRNILALQIPKMTDAEVLQIVANGESEAGLPFDAAAGDLVVTVARGSPYIANLVCHHASHRALDQDRKIVLRDDVEAAVAEAGAEFQSRLARSSVVEIRRLVAEGRGELLALAARAAMSQDENFTVDDLYEPGDASMADAVAALELLTARGLLKVATTDKAGKRYTFVEDSLPIFLSLQGIQASSGATAWKASRQKAATTTG